MSTHTVQAQSLPGHLVSDLPRQAGPGKGLPAAERSEPLSGLNWGGSRPAGDREGDPFPGSWPSAEEALDLLRPFDQAETDSAAMVYKGLRTPLDHMVRVYEIRAARAEALDALGWHKEADEVRDRMAKEMGL